MALSMMLGEAGYSPDIIEIKAEGDDISIPTIELDCTALVAEIDEDEFQKVAEQTRGLAPIASGL